ncbi:phosphogluconate dehydratase [Devosia psychrophila]|uniref:Phosphogluconate dehydratase n=1 Tax=Devosia psychrophila TaxID=728005 RepID=A0A0F5PWX6_9HYPH|nr:phosphogluconate dehydratase [Devosia psychrophila]KKC33167.1 phosphogluconate dehydratase [Devosia psychrophila]SFC29027.1 6-phosphogluconate dehydratase [Devosia psychrophila]
MSVRQAIQDVTTRIAARSRDSRRDYLSRVDAAREAGVNRAVLSCGNLAHAFAACTPTEKAQLAGGKTLNLAIITSYNDMLSAHQPYQFYPDIIKQAAREVGATAQVAGGVPAMCDGVTQGQPGMDLSLFSRDVIAMATAISLSHNMFDAAVYLGICDKIVPGLLIGALTFGHLPAVFVPAGPMPSGIPNDEKSKVRQLYMEGKVGRAELLEAESKSYHSAGTCTFYGTANSNQMLMEIMGLHLPGASFVNPGTPLRDALTREATVRALSLSALGNNYTPVGHVVDEKSIVNGLVGLHATGGSTNHTMHLIAIAAAAGLHVTWDDMSDLSDATPLLARVYPNGVADVNHFHAAGGMGFLIQELLESGHLHEDVKTVWGDGLSNYKVEAKLIEDKLTFEASPKESALPKVLTKVATAFSPTGGLKLLSGNLGRSVIKVSAVKPEHRVIEAPARVFHGQEGLQAAFKAGDLNGDMIAVVRFSGPRALGMPELHKLTPSLGILQDRGFKVALLTDGRMSGASGKVPAAIHMTPEAIDGGPISKIRDGDMIRLDANAGTLTFLGDEKEFFSRTPATEDLRSQHYGMGRELFAGFRSMVGVADRGASVFQ